jgi:hypothetical protein
MSDTPADRELSSVTGDCHSPYLESVSRSTVFSSDDVGCRSIVAREHDDSEELGVEFSARYES